MQQLEVYAELLRRSPHNLLSPTGLRELESRHFPESLALAELLPRGETWKTLVDVGAGGGLPGLVIALARPDLVVTLVESRRKKAEFLIEAASALDLHVEVLNARAEDVIEREQREVDLVTARAVAPLHRLLGWTIPMLRAGGRLYAVKGERWVEELQEAQPALRRWGGEVIATPADGPTADPVAPLTVIVARRPRVGA